MPVINPRAPDARAIAVATEGVRPRQHVTANTNSSSLSGLYSAQGEQRPVQTPTEGIETPTETPVEGQSTTIEAETKTPESVTLSPQVTALARKEQQFRQKEQAFKAREAALAAKETELEAISKLKKSLDAKDYSALEGHVPYEEYTNYLLNKGEGPSAEAQALKALESEVKSLKTSQEEQADKQYKAIVNQYRGEVKTVVSNDPRFVTVKEMNAEEHVLQHILDTFEQDNVTLSVEEAAQEIEEHLEAEALKMAGLTKVKSKQAVVPEKKTLPPPTTKAATQLKTITQQIAPATKSYAQSQHMSPRERLAAALAKAQKPQ